MPTIVDFETLTELYQNLTEKYKNSSKTAFAFKPTQESDYKTISWDKVKEDVSAVAGYLVEEGAEPGDRIAILSENRYEWAVVDFAIQLIGCVNVGLYTTLPSNQCEFILKDSESKFFFVSTGIQLKKAVEVFDACEHLKHVIAFDKPRLTHLIEKKHVTLFSTVLEEGKGLERNHTEIIRQFCRNVKADTLATLIYTSGTTGKPKGAMLTHRNIVSNIKSAHEAIHIDTNDRSLSFLPLSHSFERTGGFYAMIAAGAEIYYAESVDTVAKNMIEAKPTIVISVPRLFEKIYNLVTKSVEEGNTVKKTIFHWSMKIGKKYSEGNRGLVSLQKSMADVLVFNKLKQRTGERIRFFVSGGAALPAEIGDFFMSAGLNVLEGYGLTETSPIMTCNRYGDEKMGTVGKVINGVTVGIQRLDDNEIIARISGEDYPTDLTSEPGEILCKGPNVMKGYWKNEEATKEMIDQEGWLHTGDIGRFMDGRLKITDRIKHMIVNAGGKNIYPGPIEDMFKTSKWVDQIVIVGEKKSYMAALVVPDFDSLEKYAGQEGIGYESTGELLKQESILNLFDQEIRQFSRDLASHEKIRDFRLIPEEFTVETGELTPTLKVKRRVIEQKFGDLIEDIYKDDRS